MGDMPGQTGEREWVKVLDEVEDYHYKNLFRVIRTRLQHRLFSGKMSEPITRLNFERGDSVGVLLYIRDEDAVILVRQFRYPVYARLKPEERAGEGARRAWLLEIIAGVIEEDRDPARVARDELREEVGYDAGGRLEPIGGLYPSPGGTSERVWLFMAEATRDQVATYGGSAAEGEDIQVEVTPVADALAMVARGEIVDAKTIIALQHLALARGEHGGK